MATITFTGTGGIIEGNLGAANVNVNLDAALSFDGSDDYVKIAGNADFNFGTGDFTIAGWIKGWDTNGTAMYLFDMRESGNTEEPAIYFSNPNVVYYANGAAAIETTLVCSADDWNHIALSRISGVTKLYINGVEKGSVSDGTDYDASANTIAVNLGRRFSGSNFLNGNIADFRIYKGEGLSAANIQVLASKINGDSSLGAGTTNLKVWLKINDGTGTAIDNAQGTSATDGVAVGSPAWVFDQYYVDVQDNSTTTDGTFTVTQGKVEGLALTSVDFDGSNDYISLGTGLTTFDGATEGTFSAWVKRDGTGSEDSIISHYDSTDSNRQFNFLVNSSNQAELNVQNDKSSYNSSHVVAGTTSFASGVWYHMVGTFSTTNGQKIYVNGIQEGTAATTIEDALDTVTTDANIGVIEQGGSLSSHTNGNVRDVRLYSQELSADQVASLYADTLPITPTNWWKIDDATQTATATIEDYGTGTDVDGTGVSLAWTNGTLDLDGALTIAANGTLSAPRGNLTMGANILANGNYIHNNGTFAPDLSGVTLDASSTQVLSFYDLDPAARFICSKSINVENELGGASQIRCNGATSSGGLTITMGTTSSAGNIAVGFFANWSNNCTTRIVAADTSGINRWTMQSSVNLQLGISTGEFWEFANGDIQISTLQTKADYSNDKTVTLTGDMEFDAVTVSSGDTLDCTDQRAVFSGLLTVTGTIDVDGALIFVHDVAHEGTLQGYSTAAAVYTGAETYSIGGSWDIYTNMLNIGAGNTASWGSYLASNADWIIGSGKLQTTNYITHKNMTIATGGELDGQDDTLTFSGDFTTSGGLLGASAIDLNGSQQHYSTASAVAVGTNSDWTIEGWMKRDNGTSGNQVFVELRVDGSNANRVFVNVDTDDIQLLIWSNGGSGAEITTVGAGLNDGKWHHIACTYDSTTAQIFIDGKLTASGVLNKAQDNTDDRIINVGANVGTYANEFTGAIDEVRIWSDVRTETEIRANMFSEVSSGDGLVQNWRFNEGTGDTAAANVGNSLAAKVGGNSASSQSASLWAGAGTFTYGTSTLKMTGTNKYIYHKDALSLYKFEIETGGDSNAITLKDINGGNSTTVIYHTIEQKSGKLVSDTGEMIQIGRTFGNVLVAAGKGATAFAEVERWYIFQNSTTGSCNFPSSSSADKDLTINDLFITSDSEIEVLAQGNLTFPTRLRVDDNNTFNASGNTITSKLVDMNGTSTLNVGSSTLVLSHTSGLTSESGVSLNGGPGTTISGSSAPTTFESQNNFAVVGKIENLDVTNQELKVTGQVINCTGDIHQYFPTIDHAQQLDADTADDRDIQLHGDKLDRDTELINS